MTTQREQHTPTPWALIRRDTNTYTLEVSSTVSSPFRMGTPTSIRSIVAELEDIALCPEHGGTAEANARFIVTACNAHAELVKALAGAARIEGLRDAISENYARLKTNGRTVAVESHLIARKNIDTYRAELKSIRTAIDTALQLAEGEE